MGIFRVCCKSLSSPPMSAPSTSAGEMKDERRPASLVGDFGFSARRLSLFSRCRSDKLSKSTVSIAKEFCLLTLKLVTSLGFRFIGVSSLDVCAHMEQRELRGNLACAV